MSRSLAAAPPAPLPGDATARPASGGIGVVVLVSVGFLCLWAEVINHLRAEWTVNPQYGYGWIVPFLALYVFAKRWTDRPAPEPARSKWLAMSIAVVAALPLLPARIISIANPDWRLLSWALASSAVVITFAALYLAGGVRWLRHFAFPVLFFLVAVPWPAQFEQSVVQGLMRADAAMVVAILNGIGTIAVQRGNVIELSTGLVGIADACTGIRSLQSTLMISLFLGEFYRMPAARRMVLVVSAALLAFICNLGRTLLLCLVASSSGVEAIHTWHDSAGLTILLICIFALWLLSLLLNRGRAPLSPAAAPSPIPAGGYTRRLAFLLLLWVGFTEISSAAWYHARNSNGAQATSWSVTWPTTQASYAAAAIPEEAQELLLYNEGGGANWVGAEGRQWLMYYFRWLPGRTAARFVKFHRPDICLPASGMTMTHDFGIRLLTVHGVSLPIRSYRFENRGTPLHIYYCYWDARSTYDSEAAANEEDWTARGRVRAAIRGRREIGAQMLELVVWGYSDDEEAAAALRQRLGEIVHRG